MFGEDLVNQDKVDRKALGTIVFSDTKKREKLEALLHPLIYQHIEHLAIELDKKKEPYLVDIPLFFENKSYPIERVIVVYTPKEIQLKRLIKRDKSSQIDAQKRIDIQLSIEDKRTYATYIIDNSSTLEALKKECEQVKDSILKGTIK
jgi:dephospho-CoA kinase